MPRRNRHLDDLAGLDPRATIAVRAHVTPEAGDPEDDRPSRRAALDWPELVLLIDTETTTDAAQRLLFGSYRVGRWQPDDNNSRRRLSIVEEGLIYGDDLPLRDPKYFDVLERYVSGHWADVARGEPGRLYLYSRGDFVEQILWKIGYESHALITSFNLPFDLSRLAVGWGEARASYRAQEANGKGKRRRFRGQYAGGFSLKIWDDYWDAGEKVWRENSYRPRITIKHLDSKRAFTGFTGVRGGRPGMKGQFFAGRFLDQRTLAFALTNAGYSLDGACAAFGMTARKHRVERHGAVTPRYIAYNRQDVALSHHLLEHMREEFDRHPIQLDPCKAFSPASVAKGYLRAMGVTPPAVRARSIPPEQQGAGMSAYFGGRVECHIRLADVPVVYTDVLSMYPTCNTLMGLWSLLTASAIETVDATTAARRFLRTISLDRCLTPAFWNRLTFFAEIDAADDVLPVRARYSDSDPAFTIGVNRLSAPFPLWYAGADLAAAALLSGKVPHVRRAFRLIPHGRLTSLRPVRLRGSIRIDPRQSDFFRAVIEERHRLDKGMSVGAEEPKRLRDFLKVLANSGSYGVFAQYDREEPPGDELAPVRIYGAGQPFLSATHAVETQGEYCFGPLAALTTAGARLMLATLERLVAEANGTYALCDTDSMAIVATMTGGLVPCEGGGKRLPDGRDAVRALSWADVRRIIARLDALKPYGPSVSDTLLKVESENFRDHRQAELRCIATSAKRYSLWNLDEEKTLRSRKVSEHGLGHLLDPMRRPDIHDRRTESEPPSWMISAWRRIASQVRRERTATRPAWARLPALTKSTVSSPVLAHAFDTWNAGKPYSLQIKPFNFLLSAHVAPFSHPAEADPARFHLIAPFESDPRKWLKLPWFDKHSRGAVRFGITTNHATTHLTIRVKSYVDVLDEYARHPEPKSAAPDGTAADEDTTGVLGRRHFVAQRLVHIGKEAIELEAREEGAIHNPEEALAEYQDPKDDSWTALVLPVLKAMPRAQLAAAVNLTERRVQMVRNGAPPRQRAVRAKFRVAAGTFARAAVGNESGTDLEACAEYLRRIAQS